MCIRDHISEESVIVCAQWDISIVVSNTIINGANDKEEANGEIQISG